MPLNVIDAAHTVSFHLNDLLDDETEIQTILSELDELLRKVPADKNVESQIRDILKSNEKLSQWAHEFLNPLNISKTGLEIYQELPGKGMPIDGMTKYVCPKRGFYCNYWFPNKAGQKIPKCRKHGIALVPEHQEEEEM